MKKISIGGFHYGIPPIGIDRRKRKTSWRIGYTARKEQNMTNIQKKAARAEIVADIEEYLICKADALRTDAKYDMDNCPVDDETGEIDKSSWRYESAHGKTAKAALIGEVLKDLEKF